MRNLQSAVEDGSTIKLGVSVGKRGSNVAVGIRLTVGNSVGDSLVGVDEGVSLELEKLDGWIKAIEPRVKRARSMVLNGPSCLELLFSIDANIAFWSNRFNE